MDLLWHLLPVVGSIIVAIIVSWVSFRKLSDQKKKAEKEEGILGIHGLLEANKEFRDEIRADYLIVKAALVKKTLEADEAWKRFRECEGRREAQKQEIERISIDFKTIKCEFEEFRKICEAKHGLPAVS